MVALRFWEYQNAVKTLYNKCVGQTCQRHGITRMELDILLFLANNPSFDTAAEIVELRRLSKSQVSASVKLLEQRGFLHREYAQGNRKTVHLKLYSAAEPIIRDGKAAQERFFSVMLEGFSPSEIKAMESFNQRIRNNIDSYLKEDAGY